MLDENSLDSAVPDHAARRGPSAALLATPLRIAVVAAVTWSAVGVFVFEFVRTPSVVAHRLEVFVGLALPLSILFLAVLLAEEARLVREIRTACDGSPALRQMILRRREKQPIFIRWLSTQLGIAALLLAEGEDVAAGDAVVRETPFVAYGRMARLKALVEADLTRARRTEAARESALAALAELRPLGNRAADLYRAHVLTRTLLEGAQVDRARVVAEELRKGAEETARTYGLWLLVWFDLDGVSGASSGELRMAALLARTHGADALVEKIGAALVARGEGAPATELPTDAG